MRRTCFLFASMLLLNTSNFGCATHQLCRDQEALRHCVLDLYTNQIMDNLIRAYNGLPIVQLDYSKLTATVTVEVDPSLGATQQFTHTNLLTLPAATLAKTRQFVGGFSQGGAGKDNNVVTMTADPLINQDEVYKAYLTYLCIPGGLVATCDAPAPCDAHLVRRFNNMYYWVPKDHQKDFFQLALVTTVMRGHPLGTVPQFFETTVTEIQGDPAKKMDQPDRILTLKLNPAIKNDDGLMHFNFNGKKTTYTVQPVPSVKLGDLTTSVLLPVQLNFTQQDVESLTKALLNQKVQFEQKHFRPDLPTTQDLLKSLNFVGSEVQQLRLQNPLR
jgi:hypothetical protein